MKKAKAIFAAGMIIVVAGASAALWYLNDKGIIGNESTTVYTEETENYADDVAGKNDNQQDNDNNETEQQTQLSDEKTDIAESEINDFLTTFAKVYFAEKGTAFDINKRNDYELILFAFSHIRCTDKSLITLEQRDDDIMYYNRISAEKVNEVLKKYFDTSVASESVYTENSYAFFSYSDGYFYTPAADGIAYKNNAVSNSVEYENDQITVNFTVYSGDEFYSDGEAKIQIENGEMKLVFYAVHK